MPAGRANFGRISIASRRSALNKMLPATAEKLVMVHMWLKLETMKESGKWEADLLQHTDEDLTWEQITSLDED